MTSTPTKHPARTILLADPDHVTVRWLGHLLRDRGFQVHAASDGSQALQITLLRHPDLVLFDQACTLIEAEAFLRILRSNPRTESIPVIVTGQGDRARPAAAQGWLRKPFAEDELFGRIEQVLRGAPSGLPAPESELRGQLSHLPVPDLLQVLAMNRRTGRLVIRSGGGQGEIFVVEGKVHDARAPGVFGEKAFFRILAQKEGTFELQTESLAVPDRLGRSLDRLLLDGSYQADELSRVLDRLPRADERIELAVEPRAPLEPEAAVDQILEILRSGPSTVGALIDRCASSDLDAALALEALLVKGAALVIESPAGTTEAPLVDASQLHVLRQRLIRSRGSWGGAAVAKVLLVADEGGSARGAALRLARLPGFQRDAAEGPGTIAHVELGDGVRLDLVALPPRDEMRPLWPLWSAGALGALVLDEGKDADEAAAWLHRSGLPVAGARAEGLSDLLPKLRELMSEALAVR
ncbi:MAG TPA: DUF4388 domain-containing protein [Vulgatibacter sp.]|nr:DUF4388 domain-containing protein [Vulgatibacter sp.]